MNKVKKVVVMFPVVVDVRDEDTLERIMDEAAEILSNSSLFPYVQTVDGVEIIDEEELNHEMVRLYGNKEEE